MYAALIPTHSIAVWLLKHIDALLNKLGLEHQTTLEELIYIAIIVGVALLVGLLVKRAILFVTQKAVAVRNTSVGRELIQQRTLIKCSHIIPPLVFMAMLPFAFVGDDKLIDIIGKAAGIYTLICVAIGVNAVLNFVFYRINSRENSRNLPLKGILNIAVGIVWLVIAIISISIIIGKSPAALLTGLGAFAAVLSFIFKDTLMGFVAGIQMSENDMVRVGDWIVVHGTDANGVVEDVTLSTVKIRNFDNTLVMVPPYTLVSTSFQNWRGMTESGVRRILVSVIIDLTTVVATDPERMARVIKLHPELQDFVDSCNKAADHSVSEAGIRAVNGTTLTNLGLFRAYISLFLSKHPKIAKDQRIMIRLQEPNEYGVPLNIWCFTATTQWDQYEGIYSAVLENVIMSAEDFGLGIYSSSSLTVTDVPPEHVAAGIGQGHGQMAVAAPTADTSAEPKA